MALQLIAIIDYDSGNVRSVENAFKLIGVKTKVCRNWSDLNKASHIVLPGVGAFANGMNQLKSLGLIDSLEKLVLQKGVPFLGICVGHQMLANYGYEFEKTEGMGWIDGKVEKVDKRNSGIRLPHVGWNDVSVTQSTPLFFDMPIDPCFYFVHSYHFIPDNNARVTSVCQYGSKVTASVQKDNIFGVQFHPEKSQSAGLLLLKNFSNFS